MGVLFLVVPAAMALVGLWMIIGAVPAYSDVGMLDRSDTDVRVLYDPERPERFIAPKSARMGTGAAVARIVFALVFLAFVAGFVVLSQGLMSSGPTGF